MYVSIARKTKIKTKIPVRYLVGSRCKIYFADFPHVNKIFTFRSVNQFREMIHISLAESMQVVNCKPKINIK